jgi:AcrR family transcriptional regulator
MKGLATDAGVSRQLVYDHFEDGEGLLLATIQHLFEGSHRATAGVLQSSTGDVPSTIRETYRIFLDLPVAQRRVLRAISGGFVPDQPEARRVLELMREQIFALWVPYARSQTGLSERELRPRVWMLNGAAWGLADLVDDGTVSKERATNMLAHLVDQVMAREKTTGMRRKASASPRPRKRRTSRKGE